MIDIALIFAGVLAIFAGITGRYKNLLAAFVKTPSAPSTAYHPTGSSAQTRQAA